jgi:3'(2'), 5'-bisphosphate nucleotidase
MLEAERDTALQAVRCATRISRLVQGEFNPDRKDKDDRSPVTVADLAVQAVIGRLLADRFPNDPLMAEEGADELRLPAWQPLRDQVVAHVRAAFSAPLSPDQVLEAIDRGQQPIDPGRRYWVLDPIDGTKGFLRKEQYAIALALIDRGEILLGALACPNLPASMSAETSQSVGQVYVAIKGQGAEVLDLAPDSTATSGEPVHVHPGDDPALANWCERVESSSRNKGITGLVVEAAGIRNAPFRLDSQAKYAVVARGETSLYLRHTLDPNYREKVWDHAAGVLLMQEAGGQVSDLRGDPLDFTQGRELSRNRGIVATNGLLHDRVLAAVARVLREHEATNA